MITLLNILLFICMASVFGSLAYGLYSMIRGGEFDRTHANRAMRWRVILQGIALFIFFLILLWGR